MASRVYEITRITTPLPNSKPLRCIRRGLCILDRCKVQVEEWPSLESLFQPPLPAVGHSRLPAPSAEEGTHKMWYIKGWQSSAAPGKREWPTVGSGNHSRPEALWVGAGGWKGGWRADSWTPCPVHLCCSKTLTVSARGGPRMSQKLCHSSQSQSFPFPPQDQSEPPLPRSPLFISSISW